MYLNYNLSDDRFSGHEVTLNSPDRFGMNEAAAAEAARLRVAADAAARRVALAAAAPGPDRNDRQTTFRPEPVRIVRAPIETGTHREQRLGLSLIHI